MTEETCAARQAGISKAIYVPNATFMIQSKIGGAITIYAHNKLEVKAEECCFVETNLALSNRPMIRGWDSVGGQSEAGATNKGSGAGICSKYWNVQKKRSCDKEA